MRAHIKQPAFQEWLDITLVDEDHRKWYALIFKERFTSTEEFPVPFDSLWPSLGYSTKGNAKRHLGCLLLDRDFITGDKNT